MNFYSFGYPIICQKERGSDTLFKIAHFLNNGATSLGLKPAIPQPMGVTRKCFCGFDLQTHRTTLYLSPFQKCRSWN